jgi:thioredoxin 1
MNLESIHSGNFDEEVLNSQQPILVEFGAVWCAPCKRLEPEMEKLNQAFGNRVRLAKVDVDESSDLAISYNVMSVPTLIMFIGGEERQRVTGFIPLPKLIEKFEPHL